MKKILFLIIFIFGIFFVFSHSSFAQTPTSSQNHYNITFPIADLGNCTSIPSCKAYCDDASHQQACIEYAKKKGFYQQTALDTESSTLLQSAEIALGCNSEESCKSVCQQEENFDKCSQFAQKFHLKGGQQNTASSSATLEKAKTILGCTSLDSCKTFCQLPENQQKCSVFAKSAGIKGGTTILGPGGCNSEEACKTYCLDPRNAHICSQFAPHTASSSGEKKPSESSHPSVSPFPPLTIIPTRMSQEEYCKMYPTHCQSLSPTIHMQDVITPSISPKQTVDIQAYCGSHGCNWDGKNCVCPTIKPSSTVLPTTISATPTPTLYCNPGSGYNCPEHYMCQLFNDTNPKHNGYGYCVPQTASSPTQQVHAAATEKNIFQVMWDYFFFRR